MANDTDLLTLSEARDALRLSDGDVTRNNALQNVYIPAVTPIVEDIVGPVVKRTVTVVVDGGSSTILLDGPVSSITSITASGQPYTTFLVDLDAGILYSGGESSRTYFPSGTNSLSVTYVAGVADATATVPANIKLAARIILASLWDLDQNGAHPGLGDTGQGGETVTGSGYRIPAEAYALLEASTVDYMGFA